MADQDQYALLTDARVIAGLIGAASALFVVVIKEIFITPRQERKRIRVQLINRLLSEIYVPLYFEITRRGLNIAISENRSTIEMNFHLFSADIRRLLSIAFSNTYLSESIGFSRKEVDRENKISTMKNAEAALLLAIENEIKNLRTEYLAAHGTEADSGNLLPTHPDPSSYGAKSDSGNLLPTSLDPSS